MLLLAGRVVAATPFGSDDTGFIPPSKGVFVCASKTQQLAGKLVVGYTKCHIRLAAAGLAGNASGSAEEGCAQASRAKFDHAVGNVLGTGCPLCVVDHVNFSPIAATIEADLDAANGSVFCAGTTALGDDDTGFVPPDATAYKCEAAVAKGLAALRYCLAKCHTKYAKSVMAGAPIDEEACESTDPVRSCRARFNRVRDRVAGICPGCLDATAQDALATGVEADVDQTNDTFYCASPSGAFVER
jgi:hypothetical protein